MSAVTSAADDEFVQMTVFPTHNNLEAVMQVCQSKIARNDETTPNGWGNVLERYFELQETSFAGL
jgi:hypothetical protein